MDALINLYLGCRIILKLLCVKRQFLEELLIVYLQMRFGLSFKKNSYLANHQF